MHRAAVTIAYSFVLAGILGLAPTRLHAAPAADNPVVAAPKAGDSAEMQVM